MIAFILCYCLISSSSVWLSCMPCIRCKLNFLNQEKILGQQSSLHFRGLYFLDSPDRPPLRRLTSTSVGTSFCLRPLCIFPELLPHFSRPTFLQTSSISSWFMLLQLTISSVSLTNWLFAFSSIFSVDQTCSPFLFSPFPSALFLWS